jgi:hypothetical protein
VQERGWNGVELISVWDCWVRDIEIINPDSGVLLNYQVPFTTTRVMHRIGYAPTGSWFACLATDTCVLLLP